MKLLPYSIFLFMLSCVNGSKQEINLTVSETLYYPNSKDIKGIYTKEGKLYNGPFKEFFRSGNIKAVGVYNNSIIIDSLKEYYDLEKLVLKSISIYELADTSKIEITNSSVRPRSVINYQSSFIEFYKNGHPKEKGQFSSKYYILTAENETDSTVSKNNEVISTTVFVERLKSCKEGTWYYYDSLGKEINRQEYTKDSCN